MLVHMIEEYARHCGHADLIRERIDSFGIGAALELDVRIDTACPVCGKEHAHAWSERHTETDGQIVDAVTLWELAQPRYGDRLRQDYVPRDRRGPAAPGHQRHYRPARPGRRWDRTTGGFVREK